MPSRLAWSRADIVRVLVTFLHRYFTFTTFSSRRISVSAIESIEKNVITGVGIKHDFSHCTVKPVGFPRELQP